MTLSNTISFEDFNGVTRNNVDARQIVDELNAVIDGKTVFRSDSIIRLQYPSENEVVTRTLNVELHDKLGCRLWFEPFKSEELISVGDPGRLDEETENNDGNVTFAGTYIENTMAVSAIIYFCNSGEPDPNVNWHKY